MLIYQVYADSCYEDPDGNPDESRVAENFFLNKQDALDYMHKMIADKVMNKKLHISGWSKYADRIDTITPCIPDVENNEIEVVVTYYDVMWVVKEITVQ